MQNISLLTGLTDQHKIPLTVTVMADQVLSANFVKVKYGLTLSTEGEGTVAEELISSGRVDYNSGSLVRLTATPAVGYSFTGWSGDITSISNPVEVDITSAKSITAVFDLIVVSLQVDIQGLKYGLELSECQ